MSLMDAYSSECVLLTKTPVPDGMGGFTMSGWQESVHFDAAFEYESSPEVLVAEQQGVSRVYRIYVAKNVSLDFHDVFRRQEDGQIFRVTTPGTDRHTPPSSGLNKRLIEVEKWKLPHEYEEGS